MRISFFAVLVLLVLPACVVVSEHNQFYRPIEAGAVQLGAYQVNLQLTGTDSHKTGFFNRQKILSAPYYVQLDITLSEEFIGTGVNIDEVFVGTILVRSTQGQNVHLVDAGESKVAELRQSINVDGRPSSRTIYPLVDHHAFRDGEIIKIEMVLQLTGEDKVHNVKKSFLAVESSSNAFGKIW